ncbi:hypothetical protein [Roseicella aquatilis]|uniref:UrcA family protein n=1 Tax=Roseicella aquatilis TaxID=2527868 RepID=A0A4R4DM40_9PROT|nr:hypothetical protein [Roseicella aquatilis]TCZ61153.1 hypothetical protein EXY23_13575 [Roseicella aquatilis]
MRITAALAVTAGLLLGAPVLAAAEGGTTRGRPETLERYLDQLDCAGRPTPEEAAECRAVAGRLLAAAEWARTQPPRLDSLDFWIELLGCQEGESFEARVPCYTRAGRLLGAAVRALEEPGG